MPRHSDRARYGRGGLRNVICVSITSLRTRLAFLASFVSSSLLSTSFPLVRRISRSISRSRSVVLSLLGFFSSLLPAKTTAAPWLEDAERKSVCHLGVCNAVKLLCIYYRTITKVTFRWSYVTLVYFAMKIPIVPRSRRRKL